MDNELSLRDALLGAVMTDESGAVGGEAAAAETPAAADDSAVPAGESAAVESPEGAIPPMASAENPVVAPAAAESLTDTAPAAVPGNGMPSQAEMWQAMHQLIAENARLSQAAQQQAMQVNQANAAMQEQSKAAEGAIMNQFTPEAAMPKASPAPTAPPVLSLQEVSYLPPEEQQARLAQWQQESMNYAIRTAAAQIRDEITRDMAPVKEDYEAKRRIAENEAARTTLLNMPQFADLKGKEGDLDKIIAGTPLLQGATPDQRYMLAALISRGMNSGRQMTTEELIEKASANPDVMKALEARRVAEIQQNNASLPKVVPSSGAGNANAVPEDRPTDAEGVRKKLYGMFGSRR